ncbi:MAG: hypothetical protein BWZ06_01428 [Bacteroidetes bacterium ADurb.BinA261]|nr:MAG: hypothetical protein BWZ06_01428 [Bacteroidetes bacterium ADurb.BinA261]
MPIFVSGHDHAGNPKEDDIRTRYQIVCWIIVVDVFVVGMIDAVEHRNRPQPRRKPGIEHIFVLLQIIHRNRIIYLFFCLFVGFLFCHSHHVPAFGQKIGRNAVSPPQLATDAPVFHILHPVAIGVFVFIGIEFDRIIFYCFQGRFGKLIHFQKPLHRQFGLDHFVGAFRKADLVGIGFRFFQ